MVLIFYANILRNVLKIKVERLCGLLKGPNLSRNVIKGGPQGPPRGAPISDAGGYPWRPPLGGPRLQKEEGEWAGGSKLDNDKSLTLQKGGGREWAGGDQMGKE